MAKKKMLVWETLATVSGGQKMTLTVVDMLVDQYEFCFLIPAEGMLSRELKKRNIPFILMGDQTLPTGVKGKRVIFRYGWMTVKNVVQSLGVMRRYQPDILYCPGPAALPWSAVCGSLARKPVIWHLHHFFLDGSAKKLLNICGKWNSVRTIIGVCHCVGDQIVSQKAHRKVEVLYNTVDAEKFAHGNPDKILAEVELNLGRKIAGGSLILAHIAAITKEKCQDVFIKTIRELKQRGTAVVGLMIGDAITEADQQYKKRIFDYMKDHDLDNDIFAPGFRKDTADILAATDCVLVPSYEGLSLVILEAMSARKWVVTMDRGGSFELLNAAGCGVVYPADGTEADIADAILKAKHQTAEMLENGYRFCLTQSYENYRTSLKQIFNEYLHIV